MRKMDTFVLFLMFVLAIGLVGIGFMLGATSTKPTNKSDEVAGVFVRYDQGSLYESLPINALLAKWPPRLEDESTAEYQTRVLARLEKEGHIRVLRAEDYRRLVAEMGEKP